MIESAHTLLPMATNDCSCCGPATDAMVATGDHSVGAVETETHAVTYQVEGMTCGHCVGAVVTGVSALDAVDDVQVELVAGGVSSVIVTGRASVDVVRAVIEAADYRVVTH